MNSNSYVKKHLDEKVPKNKIKMNSLSGEIFKIIQQHQCLKDDDLMKQIVCKLGNKKGEQIKRRKYDVLNILQMADIIEIQCSESGENKIYRMKHDLPNSVKDRDRMKVRLMEQERRVEVKKQIIKMLRNTQMNLQQLAKMNSLRETKDEEKVKLPFMIVTSEFQKIKQSKRKDELDLNFPEGTEFINNAFGHSIFFAPEVQI